MNTLRLLLTSVGVGIRQRIVWLQVIYNTDKTFLLQYADLVLLYNIKMIVYSGPCSISSRQTGMIGGLALYQ